MSKNNLITGRDQASKALFSMMDSKVIKTDNHTFSLTSNVINGTAVREEISATLSYISNILSKTLGPYGTNTIVSNTGELKHFLSKDGYSVLKEITFQEPIPRTILDFIKRISFRLVRTVGDGSTTAVVASDFIYQHIVKNYDNIIKTISPKDFMDLLDRVAREITTEIYASARPIKDMGDLEKIAYISTNNDAKTSKMIRGIFDAMKDTNIDISIESDLRSIEDRVELNTGYTINRSFIDPILSTEITDTGVRYEVSKAIIFACDGTLTKSDYKFVSTLFELYNTGGYSEKGYGLVFLARGFENEVRHEITAIKQKYSQLHITAIDVPTNTFDSMQRFTDLCTYLGCDPYLKDSGVAYDDENVNLELLSKMVGFSDKVISKDSKTVFFSDNGDVDKVIKRVTEIKDAVASHQETEDALERDSRVSQLRHRINMLAGKSATIYVGGRTSQEVENRKFLIEDAVYACQSAAQYGVVSGGSLIIPKILSRIKARLVDNMKLDFPEAERPVIDTFIIPILINTFSDVFSKVIHHMDSEVNLKRLLANMEGSDDPVIQKLSTDIETYINLSSEDKEEEGIIELLTRFCVDNPYMLDAKRFTMDSEEETLVINSAQTDIEVLRSTTSIISLIAASDQFVSGR